MTFLWKHMINSQINSARNQKMTAEALVNQSHEKIDQLKDEVAEIDAEEGEQEMVFGHDEAADVADDANSDFRQGGVRIRGVRTHPMR